MALTDAYRLDIGAPSEKVSHGAPGMSVTPGELAKTIAKATGIELQVVTQFFRRLREADMLAKKGRGPSAASMTRLDAARVLVAMLITERPVDAPKAVRDFGTLRLHGYSPIDSPSHDFGIDEKDDGETFEEGTAAILRFLAGLSVEEAKKVKVQIWSTVNDLVGRIDGPAYRHSYAHQELLAHRSGKDANLETFYALRAPYRGTRFTTNRGMDQEILLPVAAMFREA
jgi:hypothetical protein